MIGLSGLIDSLLTAKSSPRPDVLAIKGETEIGAPGPVLGVGRVDNDVRLPSNAALDRLIPAGNAGVPHLEGGPGSVQAELSVAARVISAVLADLHGDAGPVRGPAPAWPSVQTPSAAVLARALSQTVSDSGLFYESHLIEFAGGTRTIEQMAREPQAQWTPLTSPSAADSAPAPRADARPQAAPQLQGDRSPAAEVIHPQAVTLVHQQLDLLATAVFRWNGQAWPGVSMDWSIHQEIDEREGRGATEEAEAPRPWSTMVSLDLPRLGSVDLRLSLAGPSVQARLKAREASTIARLRADSGELSLRLQTAGLHLQEFRVDAMEQP